MKTTFLCLLLLLSSAFIYGQNSYIQVNGEPDLSVYLNNQFKGKTTAEYNGLIIEKVTAGKNLIKIEKKGYTSFEEYISVKAGEVFAYKVKPFSKHIVQISEQGNTAVSEEKAAIVTGKLIIQSVPIEIKITIPDIEGIKNNPKTKDEWIAEEIPEGNYQITFTFNQKVITRSVLIRGNYTSSVFVNMLTGDYSVQKALYPKLQLQNDLGVVRNIIDSLCREYKFKSGLSEYEFRNYNSGASQLIPMGGGSPGNEKNGKPARKDKTPGAYNYFFYLNDPVVIRFTHILAGEPHADAKMLSFYNEQLEYYTSRIAEKYLFRQPESFSFRDPSREIEIRFAYRKSGSDKRNTYSYVEIYFSVRKVL